VKAAVAAAAACALHRYLSFTPLALSHSDALLMCGWARFWQLKAYAG